MKRIFAAAATAALCLAFSPPAHPNASTRLAALAQATYQAQLDLEPLLETYREGAGPRQGRLAIPFSRDHLQRSRVLHRRTLAGLKVIPVAELDETERITHRLLEYQARIELEGLEHPLQEHALLSQSWGGIANQIISVISIQPFRNESDYRTWFMRLRRYPALLAEARMVLERSRRVGITTPAVLVRAGLAQWAAIVPADGDPARSSLWKPIRQFPAELDPAARQRIEGEYRELLRAEILPAMGAFFAYARDDYLPHARSTDGIAAIAGGERMYRHLVRLHTTTDLSPDEIHERGLREVRRIQTQLILVAAQAGFKGEMKDFGGWIASRPENFPFTTTEEVLAYLRMIHETRIAPEVPRLFSKVPRAGFEIRLTEPELAATASATYTRPASDGSRPGIFRIPVTDPKTRSLDGLRALLAHEGVPGHHFDHGFADELDVPQFRRNFRTVAFGEGWALYAESLGHEMQLYDEPLSLMGRYNAELFRAARLVVDTGLHSRGWTRERAIRYFMEEAGIAEPRATSEIHRYMANPAQALGYKLGEGAILELRAEAERRLGPRFDIRVFHDMILGQGHLPLSMLRERIGQWISAASP